jgi:2-polyprenyl-3-methyl-5-hydroxy-6-metoxy-1,4-benzoquinol methylase
MTLDAGEPAAWLTSHAHLLPTRGVALDLACGRGRHARWLARRGLRVDAIDRDAESIAAVAAMARAEHLDVTAEVRDLEMDGVSLGQDAYDVIVVVHYLHRALFRAIKEALRPSGLLVYETFTHDQARRGRPTNPAFLLAPGELTCLVAPLTIVEAREGDFDGRDVASIVARRP